MSLNNYDNWKVIQIFRAGTHTDKRGNVVTVSNNDLQNMAAAYNAHSKLNGEAPLYSGHPEAKDKGFGSAIGLAAKGTKLYAVINPTDELVRLVKAGEFDSVSACFDKPDQASNPTPGVYYLRHIGFLGRYNGLRPIVKNMETLKFMEAINFPVVFRGGVEHVYFSEMNSLVRQDDSSMHHFIHEFSRGCDVSYSEAVNMAQPFIWRR